MLDSKYDKTYYDLCVERQDGDYEHYLFTSKIKLNQAIKSYGKVRVDIYNGIIGDEMAIYRGEYLI
jgi:hypothetical protein